MELPDGTKIEWEHIQCSTPGCEHNANPPTWLSERGPDGHLQNTRVVCEWCAYCWEREITDAGGKLTQMGRSI